MCIRVQYASLSSLIPWDPTRNVISIPTELTDSALALQAVRRVLAELAIPQPKTGARCYCGEEIRLLAEVPEQ